MNDQGRHRRAVVTRGQRVVLAKTIRIIDYQSTCEGDMVSERQPIQQGDPRQLRRGTFSGYQVELNTRFRGRRRDVHRGERADKHDFVCGQQLDRLGTVGGQ